MSEFMPDTARAPSPEALADLTALARDHGMNAEMIQSLTASKEEASAHIRFFKRMMFVSNGAFMALGAAAVVFGGMGLLNGLSVVRALLVVIGVVLFAKFFTVFLSMREAIRETEAVARKHDLI